MKKFRIFNTLILDSWIIAELQRAKRASEAPWVRKIGSPSSRENLVMTSAYERASEPTSFPGSSLYLEKVPWLRLVTCLLDFSRFQRYDSREGLES